MEYFLICTVALVVSGLTLFSGFGLGTLLMPVFALFFPLPVAIAATAVVHLVNNFFKVYLVGRNAKMPVVIRFAIPGAISAMFGAMILKYFSTTSPIFEYQLFTGSHQITAMKLIIAVLIIIFALFDLIPKFRELSFDSKYIPIGGAISGFFGGLSGHQGAMRSAFLIKSGLTKEEFIGTGVVSAVVVDIARLIIYGIAFYSMSFGQIQSGVINLVIVASLSAFIGAFIGKRVMQKITLKTVQVIVGIMLILLGLGLGSGII
ncbi:MAG: sulfite exporter TauE/SafE family protein [Candidatus Marinimicrobia bacterium]|nr:sulfite exporter TauE/SafE family protein [Candidatus Neomarinimicrobiota bacterium]MBL7023546.1 sulfite exporter TauE/SafE family protein [Candidatus Neomarinimicrobiota bacterium]MBL7109570.1 sulfite exporter TauE/SafE family protein [Candidatus Neomarinimicrobiota bacterium]